MQQNIQWYTCTKVFFPLKKNLIVIAGVHSIRKKNRGVYERKIEESIEQKFKDILGVKQHLPVLIMLL